MKLYMFRTVPLSIIRSLFTVHSAMIYVIQICRQLSSRTRSCSKAVWHIPLLSVQWINSWWWTDELSETCRFSCQNKFVKLVHLVGFITKKNVIAYFDSNVRLCPSLLTTKIDPISVVSTVVADCNNSVCTPTFSWPAFPHYSKANSWILSRLRT